jgi:uncharacterized protein (UPF0276 family)
LWERRPSLALLEVHSENFFGDGGEPLAWLERFRGEYPLSVHGVGLSLGSADALDERHLARLDALVRRVQPALVSEHLSWSSIGGVHANDLLPLPFTREALDHVVERIERVQERLGCAILVENVSTYATFAESTLAEAQFVAEAVRRSGCGLLLDVNNVWVNASNHGFDAYDYLDAFDAASIGEMHLAGFEARAGLLVDTHAAPVADEVWALYREAVRRFGPKPTIVEWLLEQAARAEAEACA